MPDLIIQIDEVYYTIPPVDYTFAYPSYYSYPCKLLVESVNDDQPVTLGGIFLQDYYTTFNYDNNTVGFALTAFSDATISEDEDDDEPFPAIWVLILITLPILLLLGAIAGSCCSNSKQES